MAKEIMKKLSSLTFRCFEDQEEIKDCITNTLNEINVDFKILYPNEYPTYFSIYINEDIEKYYKVEFDQQCTYIDNLYEYFYYEIIDIEFIDNTYKKFEKEEIRKNILTLRKMKNNKLNVKVVTQNIDTK